jgi:hypothetical protein
LNTQRRGTSSSQLKQIGHRFFLFDMQNWRIGPYLATIKRILIPAMYVFPKAKRVQELLPIPGPYDGRRREPIGHRFSYLRFRIGETDPICQLLCPTTADAANHVCHD